MSAQEKQADTGPRLIPARVVERMVGVSRWSLWRYGRDGHFPKSIRMGGDGTARVWVEQEVKDWIAKRMADR